MSNRSTLRIVSCAVTVGVLFAVVSGVSVSGSASSSDAAAPGVETGFSPTFALIGLLAGAMIGSGIGFFWGRSGAGRNLGFLLVTLLGGFTGLMAAALLGAQTVVTATATSSSMEHGAPPGVLLGGAVVGMIGGAACAWCFRPSARLEATAA